jgi:hypothetical protein
MLTKPQQEVYDRAKTDAIILSTDHEGDQWTFIDGTPVDARIISNLIEKGNIIPVGDGLFGTSQTWRAA